MPFGVDHAENEQSENGGKDDNRFEPEEPAELVGTESAEREVDKPEKEESQHSRGSNTNWLGDMVWNVREAMAKDAAKDIWHEASSGIHWYLVRNNYW